MPRLDLGLPTCPPLDLRTQASRDATVARRYDGAITLSVLDRTDIVYVERISPKILQRAFAGRCRGAAAVHCTAMAR